MRALKTMNHLEVSLVIPLYNEEKNLRRLCAEIHQALDERPWSYEILFVDDGSTDDSCQVLTDLTFQDERIRALRLAQNAGQSAALAVGFDAARAPIIVTLDADLQNDPADIPRLLEALEGCDVVSGVRTVRQDDWLRRISSRIANGARRWFLKDSISDIGCALKAYRAQWLEELPRFNGMHRFLPSLLQNRGAVVQEISVNHRPRLYGVSKYGLQNRLWRGLYDLVGVRWLSKRWIAPPAVREIVRDLG